jgi:DNA-binding NarL/FixJ family response regulator
LKIRNPNIQIVALAGDGEEGWRLAVQHRPDVVLMDVRMPVMDGVESARRIRTECPEAKIIMLTTFNDDEYLFDALKLGVSGYLLKDILPEEVESAILSVFNGGALISPDMTVKVINKLNMMQRVEPEQDLNPVIQEVLTPREYDVFRLIALGYDNKKIAKMLYLTEGTIRNHVSSIYGKLELRDRVQIVKYAIEHRVI